MFSELLLGGTAVLCFGLPYCGACLAHGLEAGRQAPGAGARLSDSLEV